MDILSCQIYLFLKYEYLTFYTEVKMLNLKDTK